MDIVYITTNSYTSMLGISMTSLLENTKDFAKLKLHILSPDLDIRNKKLLLDLCSNYGRSVSFYDIAGFERAFPFSFNTSGFHPIVLARLLMADYLPDTLDTALYLDCDVIVSGSILPLETIVLEGCAFAAVPELAMPTAQKKYIGLKPEEQYYNAGIMLINLKYWRKNNLKQQCFDYYASMNGNLLYSDQDILNHCCREHILPLSHRYNLAPVLRYFPRYFIRRYQPAYYEASREAYQDILNNPSMIHFLGDERPWFKGNFNPYRKVYAYYKSISLWKEEPLISGKEGYLFCYHLLNCITWICPWFRKAFTRWIGIRYYKLIGKKQ